MSTEKIKVQNLSQLDGLDSLFCEMLICGKITLRKKKSIKFREGNAMRQRDDGERVNYYFCSPFHQMAP